MLNRTSLGAVLILAARRWIAKHRMTRGILIFAGAYRWPGTSRAQRLPSPFAHRHGSAAPKSYLSSVSDVMPAR
jgi:hypothetical protein